MPIVAKHVRLTNSGKLPDLFLTAKVQAPTDLADINLGKLYFVVQINTPWNHAASIGSSIINVIGREYYRQAGAIPLDDFERAIAKANRLIDQLAREGDQTLPANFHALVALAVADEIHIAYAGTAEAYFMRDGKLNLITEPGQPKDEPSQTFNNLITGELSAGDVVFLGSPGLYSVITSDDLQALLQQPLHQAGLALAKRLQSARYRAANAIILNFQSLQNQENTTLNNQSDTIYLDQRLESTWELVKYYSLIALRPPGKALNWLSDQLRLALIELGELLSQFWQKNLKPKLTDPTKPKLTHNQFTEKFSQLVSKLPKLPTFPGRPTGHQGEEAGVPVHHYLNPPKTSARLKIASLPSPIQLITNLIKQLRSAIQRSPRLWYMIIAFVLLGSIAASVQMRQAKSDQPPTATAATIEEMKSLIAEAKQAKIYGNSTKARELYLAILAKGETTRDNAKLANQAGSLIGTAQNELQSLAGATELTAATPLVSLTDNLTAAVVHEGSLYYATEAGGLFQHLLTGGESTILAELPATQAAHELLIDSTNRQLLLQNYTGAVYSYSLTSQKLTERVLKQEKFPVATGLGLFNDTLYILDPAHSEIWKYPLGEGDAKELTTYLKTNKVNLATAMDLAIDGSVFTLDRAGKLIKFSRGNVANFAPTAIPAPFDKITAPLGFFADEGADRYYLADRGNETLPPRIIELDDNGKFIHQYFLPARWQKDIKLLMANPKSHKAWVLVKKELYEFTLVR